MAVTLSDVEHVASLAHLSVTDDEKRKLMEELNSILLYMDHLNTLDTSQVEPLSQVVELTNVLREDTLVPSIPREEALGNAPARTEKFFRVPKVLGER